MLVTIQQFLNQQELQQVQQQAELSQWEDGGQSAFGAAKTVKNNSQSSLEQGNGLQLANFLLSKMGNHLQLVSAALPQRIFPPRINRYGQGQEYGFHVDAAIMSIPGTQNVMRSDVSITIFLNEPEEYEGGELCIQSAFGLQKVKLKAGDAVVYPSASLHCVSPVTQGQRIAAISWIQSMIPDAHIREQLYHLDQSIQTLQSNNERAQIDQLSNVYHNLIRHFAQL